MTASAGLPSPGGNGTPPVATRSRVSDLWSTDYKDGVWQVADEMVAGDRVEAGPRSGASHGSRRLTEERWDCG